MKNVVNQAFLISSVNEYAKKKLGKMTFNAKDNKIFATIKNEELQISYKGTFQANHNIDITFSLDINNLKLIIDNLENEMVRFNFTNKDIKTFKIIDNNKTFLLRSIKEENKE